jgi:hypothetical protein
MSGSGGIGGIRGRGGMGAIRDAMSAGVDRHAARTRSSAA